MVNTDFTFPAEGKQLRFTRSVSWLGVHPWTRLPAFAVALWVLIIPYSCGAAPDSHRLPVHRVSRKLDVTKNDVKCMSDWLHILYSVVGHDLDKIEFVQSSQFRVWPTDV
jgi:hypothetical protein